MNACIGDPGMLNLIPQQTLVQFCGVTNKDCAKYVRPSTVSSPLRHAALIKASYRVCKQDCLVYMALGFGLDLLEGQMQIETFYPYMMSSGLPDD